MFHTFVEVNINVECGRFRTTLNLARKQRATLVIAKLDRPRRPKSRRAHDAPSAGTRSANAIALRLDPSHSSWQGEDLLAVSRSVTAHVAGVGPIVGRGGEPPDHQHRVEHRQTQTRL